jgi:hypothetical protein
LFLEVVQVAAERLLPTRIQQKVLPAVVDLASVTGMQI